MRHTSPLNLISRYLNKAECIIGQYSNYTFPELDNLPLNGVNTQVCKDKDNYSSIL